MINTDLEKSFTEYFLSGNINEMTFHHYFRQARKNKQTLNVILGHDGDIVMQMQLNADMSKIMHVQIGFKRTNDQGKPIGNFIFFNEVKLLYVNNKYKK